MTEQTDRRVTALRLSTAGTLRLVPQVVILVSLASAGAIGQAPTPTISIGDVTVTEGNSGPTTATFTVTLANPNGTESRVFFATGDGTARNGVVTHGFSASGSAIPDAGAGPLTPLTFSVSGTTDPVSSLSILFQGFTHPSPADLDILLESPLGQTMLVQSDAGANGAPNGTSYGLRDGGPAIPAYLIPGLYSSTSYPPSDQFAAPAPPGPYAEAAPGGTATLNGTFGGINPSGNWKLWIVDDTVGGQGSLVFANLAIETRALDADYLRADGELRFLPGGPATQTVQVTILGDTTIEADETVFLDLFAPINAVVGDDRGIATIVNDDSAGGSPPVAVDDAFVTGVNAFVGAGAGHGGPLANDINAAGGPMTAVLVTGPSNGTLTLQASGQFFYRPARDFVGTDTFTYRAVNQFGESNIAVATITVRPPPTTPPAATVSIADRSVVEGQSGPTAMTFDVTLSSASSNEVRVNYGMLDGTATGGLLSTTFTSQGPIAIPAVGAASSYPVTINVSGIVAPVEEIVPSITRLTHTSPGDIVVLLEGPGGRRMVIQSDVGGGGDVSNLTYSLHDAGPAMSSTQLAPGTARPTSEGPPDVFPSPAPSGPHPEAGPAGDATLASVFRGIDPNGPWKLWIADDSAPESGSIDNWALTIGVPDPATDYATRFGQVVFPPGSTTQQIVVTVNGDTSVEPHETLRVILFAPVNAGIGDDQADGTIVNDDGGGSVMLPIARDDVYEMTQNPTGLRVLPANGVLANDSINDGGRLDGRFADATSLPSNGALDLRFDGEFIYFPRPDFVGTDTFTYRVRDAFGISNIATVTIVVKPRPGVQPPGNLRLDAITSSVFRARFTPPDQGPAPTEYALTGGLLPGQTLAQLPSGSANPVIELLLPPEGTYYVRVHSIAATAQSGPSNEVPLHVNTTVTPSPPENLLGLVDGSALGLTWANTFEGGIPMNSFLRVSGAASLTLPLGSTETFTYSPVPAGTYNFEVLNGNAGGVSLASNSVTLTFPSPCSGPPQTPADFLAYTSLATGTYRVSATWRPPAAGAAPTSYELHVSSAVFTGSLPLTERSISAAAPPGPYTLSVTANNPCGTSPPTAAQTVVVP